MRTLNHVVVFSFLLTPVLAACGESVGPGDTGVTNLGGNAPSVSAPSGPSLPQPPTSVPVSPPVVVDGPSAPSSPNAPTTAPPAIVSNEPTVSAPPPLILESAPAETQESSQPLDDPAAVCVSDLQTAALKPVGIYLMIDRSTSMSLDTAGGTTKWEEVTGALGDFVSASAGFSVGLQFFPAEATRGCSRDVDCGPGDVCDQTICLSSCGDVDFSTPAADVALLPTNAPAIVGALGNVNPEGSTPMGPALRGAVKRALEFEESSGGQGIVVLVTDGRPFGCHSVGGTPAEAAEAGTAAGIPSYVVGVYAEDELEKSQPVLDRIAAAGGTDQAFIINTNTQVAAELAQVMRVIQGRAGVCELLIPEPEPGRTVDFNKVNVVTSDGTADQAIFRVEGADDCNEEGGWYYDTDPNQATPSQIHLCEQTCDTSVGTLRYEIGCRESVTRPSIVR